MTGLAMREVTVDGVTKYTIAFPLTDEDGKPINDRSGKPRFTNIVGDSPAEVVSKLAQANLEVTRALNRSNQHIETLKNKKPTPAKQPADLKGKPLTDDERVQVGLELQDPRKAAAAIEKVVESRVAPVVTAVQDQGQTLDIEARKQVARQFFARHPEYNLSANGQMLGQWLSQNGYEFSLDNIEIAFANLQDKLARKPDNAPPPPVPDNALPGNEPPNPGTPPTPQRRAPVSGISNAQVSGTPVTRQNFPYTRDELLKMAYRNDQKYVELISNPKTNAMVNAVLAGR
jgi:hypothetical protein